MNGHFVQHYQNLLQDIYAQPPDSGHTAWAKHAIDRMCPTEIETVLDVGCGVGFCSGLFAGRGVHWTGITLGEEDFKHGKREGKNILQMDMNFLEFPDNSFDMVFARHALEHSPFPVITLMEWHRVSKRYLFLINPAPDYWTVAGQNHYSVYDYERLWYCFERSKWRIIREDLLRTCSEIFMQFFRTEHPPKDRVWIGPPKIVEYRFLLEKI